MERLATSNWPKCIKCIQPPERMIFFKQVMSSFNRFQYTPKNLGEKTITLPAGRSCNLTFSEGLRCPHNWSLQLFQYSSGASCATNVPRMLVSGSRLMDVEGIQHFGKYVDILGGFVATMLKKVRHTTCCFFVSRCLFKLCYRIKYIKATNYIRNTQQVRRVIYVQFIFIRSFHFCTSCLTYGNGEVGC